MEQQEQGQENTPPDTLQPVLEVRDLGFEYSGADVRALDSISFSVHAGSILLVAGPSGCGKSTLLRCLNGLIPHSYKGTLWGEALLLGEDIFKLERAELARRVGTVLQDPSHQLVASTVGADVAFGPENLGLPVPEILGRVDRSLALLNIEQLRERDTHALSGGEHQKAAIAGVMALDPQSAWEALQLFRRLADMGRTVVLVEHRVEDALKIAPEQVLLMDAGRATYYGDVEGMREAADYRAVKLPAKWVMEKVQAEPASSWQDYAPPPTWQPSGEPLVSYRDVRFSYPTDPGLPPREIVKGVSLDVYAGDRIAVLGPNGSGKSTMLRQMIGLLKPQVGVVTVEGSPTTRRTVAQLAHTVGYVFQNPGHMIFAPTVREELAFGPQNLRRSKGQVDADVEMALRITNLVPQADRPPLALSFGQQKRVALASVLSMRPRILVMDEPTAGQDYANYTRFMDEIMSLPDIEGVIFVTHDLDLAIAYANRVWLVRDGSIVKDGSASDVLSDLELLQQCGLRPTTLLEANIALFERTGKFLRAEGLAILDFRFSILDLESTTTA